MAEVGKKDHKEHLPERANAKSWYLYNFFAHIFSVRMGYHSGRNAYILNSKKYLYVRLFFTYSKFGSETYIKICNVIFYVRQINSPEFSICNFVGGPKSNVLAEALLPRSIL